MRINNITIPNINYKISNKLPQFTNNKIDSSFYNSNFSKAISSYAKANISFQGNETSKERREQEAIKLYREGISYSKITRKTGITQACLDSLIDKRSDAEVLIDAHKQNNKWYICKDKKERIKKEYAAGMGPSAIAEEIHCSPGTVTRIVQKANDETLIECHKENNKKCISDKAIPQIIQLYKSGMTIPALRKIFGGTPNIIKNIIEHEDKSGAIEKSHNSNKVFFTDINGEPESLEIFAQVSENIIPGRNSLKSYLKQNPRNPNKEEETNPLYIAYDKKAGEIYSMFADGLCTLEIARVTGIKQESIENLILNAPNEEELIDSNKKNNVFFINPQIKEKVISWHHQGLSDTKISAKTNLSPQAISMILFENKNHEIISSFNID